jgi:hypothetical protein
MLVWEAVSEEDAYDFLTDPALDPAPSTLESLDAGQAGQVGFAAGEAIPEAPEVLAFPDG